MPIKTLLTLLLFCLSTAACGEDIGGIHVTGRGSIEVAPDMGVVRLHVRRDGSDAAELKSQLDAVVQAVLELTRELSIEERDVSATVISISPRYRRRDNESVLEGLQASRMISVTLRELDKFGDLLNRSLALGINNLDPIQLDTATRDELENQALALAMEDAKAEAVRVAEGFSVQLGSVTNVQVGGHSARPYAAAAIRSSMESGASFSPGVIRIERSLNATFSIVE